MKNTILTIAALLLLGLCSPAVADSYGYIPGASIRLGGGFNIITPEKVYPACVKADVECQTGVKGSISCVAPKGAKPAAQLPAAFAPATTFSIREIRSKYDYFRELNITASASGSYGMFSGGASFSYHSLDDIDEDSISWAVTAKSEFGAFALAEPSVDEKIAGMNAGKVIDTCGPQYIAEVDRGVMASVLYTFHSRDERKLREISASLSAGFGTGAFSLGVAGSFSEIVDTFRSHGQVSIRVFAIGGEGTSALSELIEANPTDLDRVKQLLAGYVKNQDLDHSAILAFRTSSIGKLIKRPEIDPDYSSYLYFLERINEYRLNLEDLSDRVDELVYNQIDYSEKQADFASLQERVGCELQLINLTARTCRLWTDTLAGILTNGETDDDNLARAGLTHSVLSNNPNQQIGGGAFSQGLLYSFSRNVGTPEQQFGACQTLLAAKADLNSKISHAALGDGDLDFILDEAGRPACEFMIDSKLIADLRTLPKYPFKYQFSFNAFVPGGTNLFPGSNAETLLATFDEAEEVDYVQVRYRTTPGAVEQLIGHQSNNGHAAAFSLSALIPDGVKGKEVEMIVVTQSGSSYSIVLEVPQPYVP